MYYSNYTVCYYVCMYHNVCDTYITVHIYICVCILYMGVLVACWLKCWPAIERLQVQAPLGSGFFSPMSECTQLYLQK